MLDIFNRRPGTASSTNSVRSVLSWEQPQPGVPDSLSFDRIVNGKTCSPCSLPDFVSYLRHVEHNFESLKFYMWFRDYTRRFESLPRSERGLSPEWHPPQPFIRRRKSVAKSIAKSVATAATTEFFDDHDGETTEAEGPDGDDIKMVFSESVDVEYPSASCQPFRQEVNNAISLYLLPTSPYQLNLSSHDLSTCLRGLACTTHPSAFLSVYKSVSINLRLQSHPAFIAFSVRNANPARITMIRIFSAVNLVAALTTGILLILSHHPRVKRLGCFLPAWLGSVALFNSFKGLCTILLMLGFKRNKNPWERFREEEEGGDCRKFRSRVAADDEEEALGRETEAAGVMMDEADPGRLSRERAFIASYLKMPVRSRLYDFSSVKNNEIRRLQISMFLQSALFGGVVAGTYVGILMAIPVIGRF